MESDILLSRLTEKIKDTFCAWRKDLDSVFFIFRFLQDHGISRQHCALVFGLNAISIAGGCGANSVANGKITSNTPFEKVYVHPAPGDAGGAIGAALLVSNSLTSSRKANNFTPYLGDNYTNENILEVPISYKGRSYKEGKKISFIDGIEAIFALIKYKFLDL